MIVCLVFKEYQPFFRDRSITVVHFYRNHDRAGIDLVGFLHILKLAVLFQLAHCHQRKIHQTDKFIASSRKDLTSGIQIALISGLQRCPVITVLKFDILKFC